MNRFEISVLGAGPWGAAIAELAVEAGCDVLLWTRRAGKVRDADWVAEANSKAKSGGVLRVEGELHAALERELLFLTVPPAWLRSLLRDTAPILRPEQRAVHLVRGFGHDGTPVSRVVEQETCIRKTAALAGPLVPRELRAGGLGAAVVGSSFDELINEVTACLSGPRMRVYGSRDIVGVEAAGALRIPLGLAAGLLDRTAPSPSLKAVLLTRGLAEAARLSEALGGERATSAGLAGIGDWMRTAFDPDDALVRAGQALADHGSCPHEEAVSRLDNLVRLAERENLDMPISFAMQQIVQGASVEEVLNDLMTRPDRREGE